MICYKTDMNLIRKTAAFLCATIIPLSTWSQQPMSMQQCIDYALQHNIDIHKRAIGIEQQRNILNTAQNAWQPTVKTSLNENISPHYSTTGGLENTTHLPDNIPVSLTSIGVEASMSVYDGGRRHSQKKREEFSLESLTAQMDKARKDLRIQVAYNYLKVLYSQKIAEVSQKQAELGRDLLRRATFMVNEGKSPESEQATARAQLAAYEAQYENDKGNILLNLVNLAQVMNLEDVSALQIADAELDREIIPDSVSIPAPELTFDNIVDNFPSIRAANASINMSEYEMKISKSFLLPEISVFASLGTSYAYTSNSGARSYLKNFSGQLWNNFGPAIGLNISYTLFDGNQRRNNLRNSRFAKTLAQFELDNERIKLRQELQQAYYNAITAINNYKAAVKSEQACKIDYDYQLKAYDAGRSTIFQLEQVRQKWIKAQNDAVLAKYEYIIRRKILEFYSEI